MRLLSVIFFATSLSLSSVKADEPAIVSNRKDVPTDQVVAHDPVLIKQENTYYLFTTGPGISVWCSQDMNRWTMIDPVFEPVPDWAYREVPNFNGHLWAPDISYHEGLYYLYYSVSSFGRNDSCIGLATNVTLDPQSPEFEWQDRGIVLRSQSGEDDWNAIDPNLAWDKAGNPYLAFGSFWSGLKLSRLSRDLDALEASDDGFEDIASRRMTLSNTENKELVVGNDAIEGPFIYRRGDYYYLFASVDYCCRGRDSTYKMVFGRSSEIEGPYFDEEGRALLEGGGTLFGEGDERWRGIGHNSIVKIDGEEYAVFHGYDGQTARALPKLRIFQVGWTDDDWPYLSQECGNESAFSQVP